MSARRPPYSRTVAPEAPRRPFDTSATLPQRPRRAAPHAAFAATPEAGPCVDLNALLSRLRAGDAALLLAEAQRQEALEAELAARGMPGAEECAVRAVIMASAASIAQGREP